MKKIGRKIVTALVLTALFATLTTFIGSGSTIQAFNLPAKVGRETREAFGALPGEPTDFSVSFTHCIESIGVTLVPTANVEPLVPPEFILVGTGQPVTPLVVRTFRGSISLNAQSPVVGEIVQIGAVIVPPDGTGDINNYTLFYYTNNLRLALRLLLAGVNAQLVPTIEYHLDNDNSFLVRVPLPGFPRFTLNGTVMPSPQPSGSFIANWWRQTSAGKVKMNTQVPVIAIGGANLILTTNPQSMLAGLMGGSSTGFPILQQFNSFASAQMNVSTIAP